MYMCVSLLMLKCNSFFFREIFLDKYHHQVIKTIDSVLTTSMKKEMPASGCKFQCSIHLGKIAWFIKKEYLESQLTLQSFSRISQKTEGNVHIKEDFYSRQVIILANSYVLTYNDLQCNY